LSVVFAIGDPEEGREGGVSPPKLLGQLAEPARHRVHPQRPPTDLIRTHRAVERTVPFGLVCFSLAIIWYALHGHHPTDLAARRARSPWYQTKTAPSVHDMLAKLRRVLIAAHQQGQPRPRP
jgi:hypothetical protein